MDVDNCDVTERSDVNKDYGCKVAAVENCDVRTKLDVDNCDVTEKSDVYGCNFAAVDPRGGERDELKCTKEYQPAYAAKV